MCGGGGVAGVALGLVSGYAGGKVDGFIMRVADVQLSFPAILIALLISGLVLYAGVLAIVAMFRNETFLSIARIAVRPTESVRSQGARVESEKLAEQLLAEAEHLHRRGDEEHHPEQDVEELRRDDRGHDHADRGRPAEAPGEPAAPARVELAAQEVVAGTVTADRHPPLRSATRSLAERARGLRAISSAPARR